MRVNNTFIYHTTPTFRLHAHYPYPKYLVNSVHSCLSINLNQIQTNVFIYLPVYHLSYTSITPARPPSPSPSVFVLPGYIFSNFPVRRESWVSVYFAYLLSYLTLHSCSLGPVYMLCVVFEWWRRAACVRVCVCISVPLVFLSCLLSCLFLSLSLVLIFVFFFILFCITYCRRTSHSLFFFPLISILLLGFIFLVFRFTIPTVMSLRHDDVTPHSAIHEPVQ